LALLEVSNRSGADQLALLLGPDTAAAGERGPWTLLEGALA